jgi:hypothetical protein
MVLPVALMTPVLMGMELLGGFACLQSALPAALVSTARWHQRRNEIKTGQDQGRLLHRGAAV